MKVHYFLQKCSHKESGIYSKSAQLTHAAFLVHLNLSIFLLFFTFEAEEKKEHKIKE